MKGWSDMTPEQLATYGRRLVPQNAARTPTIAPGRTNDLADALLLQIRLSGLPEPVRNHRFDPIRKWLLDLAWLDRFLAAEVNGAEFVQGRHTRGLGMAKDFEKLNAAALAGWTVLQFTGTQFRNGYAVRTLEKALK